MQNGHKHRYRRHSRVHSGCANGCERVHTPKWHEQANDCNRLLDEGRRWLSVCVCVWINEWGEDMMQKKLIPMRIMRTQLGRYHSGLCVSIWYVFEWIRWRTFDNMLRIYSCNRTHTARAALTAAMTPMRANIRLITAHVFFPRRMIYSFWF